MKIICCNVTFLEKPDDAYYVIIPGLLLSLRDLGVEHRVNGTDPVIL